MFSILKYNRVSRCRETIYITSLVNDLKLIKASNLKKSLIHAFWLFWGICRWHVTDVIEQR